MADDVDFSLGCVRFRVLQVSYFFDQVASSRVRRVVGWSSCLLCALLSRERKNERRECNGNKTKSRVSGINDRTERSEPAKGSTKFSCRFPSVSLDIFDSALCYQNRDGRMAAPFRAWAMLGTAGHRTTMCTMRTVPTMRDPTWFSSFMRGDVKWWVLSFPSRRWRRWRKQSAKVKAGPAIVVGGGGGGCSGDGISRPGESSSYTVLALSLSVDVYGSDVSRQPALPLTL